MRAIVTLSLQEVIEERRAAARPGYLDHIAAAADTLRQVGARFGKPLSALAPDFALSVPDRGHVRLSDLLQSGPVVLSFYRGEWCQFCRAELEALLLAQPAMAALGASLVMLSPEPASDWLRGEVASLGPRAHLLHDPVLGVALQYGLAYRVPEVLRDFYTRHNAPLSDRLAAAAWMLPHPADFIVSRQRRITLAFADPDFTRRLDPSLIVERLRKPDAY